VHDDAPSGQAQIATGLRFLARSIRFLGAGVGGGLVSRRDLGGKWQPGTLP